MCVYMCWVIVTPCVCMRVCVGGGYVGDGVYELVLGTVFAETSCRSDLGHISRRLSQKRPKPRKYFTRSKKKETKKTKTKMTATSRYYTLQSHYNSNKYTPKTAFLL